MGFLRLILAVCVVIAHTESFFGLGMVGGSVAVELFFIISGFYMWMVCTEKYNVPNGYRLFITNRWLRIYPIYFTVLALTCILCVASFVMWGRWSLMEQYATSSPILAPLTWAYLAISHVAIFGQDMGMFMTIRPGDGGLAWTPDTLSSALPVFRFMLVPQAWTLSLELMFYLIAPFLVRWNRWAVVATFIGCMILKAALLCTPTLDHDPWTYRFFPAELAFFLLGGISYQLYRYLAISERIASPLGIVLVSITFVTIAFFDRIFSLGGRYDFVAVMFISMLCSATLPFLFHYTKRWRWDAFLGEFSYPVYLIHILALAAISPVLAKMGFSREWLCEACVVASISASWVLIVCVSDPIERLRQRRIAAVRTDARPSVHQLAS